mgnify:CR=1 FL=1
MLIKKKIFTNNNLINLLIAFIPLSLILGNLATNINVVLICLLGIIIYKLDIFKINNKKYYYLLCGFFFYLILITLIKNIPNLSENNLYKEHIFKSLFFFRYLIIFFIIQKLFEENSFNMNLFYISCIFFGLIVSIDILIQVILKKNLFGYSITAYRPSSFFGSEHIAGGYIQKFSLFFIIFVNFFFKKNKKKVFSVLLFLFFFIVIILTGNRMPSLLFLLSILIFLLLEKQFKMIVITILLNSIIIFTVVKYPPIERLDVQIKNFFIYSKEIVQKTPKLFYYNKYEPGVMSLEYLLHFNSGAQVWKQNKIFGGGLKSFRLNCVYGYGATQVCNTHPHNYVLELLVDLGIVGFTLIYIIFILIIFDFFKLYRSSSQLKLYSIPFFLIIVTEFFPLRSSGSFFTTSNATIIFLMLSILIGILNSKKV